MTTTLLELEALLAQQIGDWREFDTSTNISTGSTAKVIATTLANYDQGQGDYYNDWWVYITEGNNSGKQRNVKDYLSTSNTLKLRGVALASESSAVTVRLHRFNRGNYIKAINRAMEQLYPSLHIKKDTLQLVTGNILPDASFDWWTSASASKFYTSSAATLAKTAWSATNDEFIRGQMGSTSMKVTDSGAGNGYAVLSSDVYPRLLDLMGKSVDFFCWAYPATTANDGILVIYTKQADGTAQTLTSTTANPKDEFSLLGMEGQTLSNDLVEVQIRFKVTTAGAVVYFDDAYLCGMSLYEYLLPEDFQDGHVSQAYIQNEGYSDQTFYDIHPRHWSKEGFNILNDGTYKYIKLDNGWTTGRRIRLIGYSPLETLSADTDTISLDGEKLNLIIAQAAYNLYEMERGVVSSEDKGRYETELNYWKNKVRSLKPSLYMMRPADTVKT